VVIFVILAVFFMGKCAGHREWQRRHAQLLAQLPEQINAEQQTENDDGNGSSLEESFSSFEVKDSCLTQHTEPMCNG
jgi:hypothetical protein